ncbi:MAG: hypothetical protein A2V88_08965 [Elusimicrobia bacterium RBG_16_66_12]|nr:MAG: hypothetical protein A2V88_08965 [Elusimicrobia bacterium RBG_16_66_12]
MPEEGQEPVTDLSTTLTALVTAFRQMATATQAPADLSGYRSVNAARGLQEIQARLDDGWDIVHLDFCEEIRKRTGVGRQGQVMAWTPYAILGKRDTLVATDRAAIALADERRAVEGGTPLGEEAEDESVPPAPAADEEAQPIGSRAPRGRHLTSQPPRSIGAEGMGALANR